MLKTKKNRYMKGLKISVFIKKVIKSIDPIQRAIIKIKS